MACPEIISGTNLKSLYFSSLALIVYSHMITSLTKYSLHKQKKIHATVSGVERLYIIIIAHVL